MLTEASHPRQPKRQRPHGHQMTRRGLLRASVATGAAITIVNALSSCSGSSDENEPVVVDEKSATNVLDDYKQADLALKNTKTYTIALGNVLHPAEGDWIPMTTAGSSASPMVKASTLSKSSGTVSEVVSDVRMDKSGNAAIFDVRCSDSAYAWVELNLLTSAWVLYGAPFANGALTQTPTTLYKGDANWDPPRLAVTGNEVIWLVMPSVSGSKTTENSACYTWSVGDASAKRVLESHGRFATDPAVSGGVLTLVPRVNESSGTYYGITAYKLSDGFDTPLDQLVLPASVRPLNAVRMADSFAFSIEASYSSGGLLSKMGTYIGSGNGPYVYLSREPAAAVAGKGTSYIIKSRASYFVVDTDAKTYAVLPAANRCTSYGEYPATMGTADEFVTYATIKDQDTGYPHEVTVRIFEL